MPKASWKKPYGSPKYPPAFAADKLALATFDAAYVNLVLRFVSLKIVVGERDNVKALI